MLALNAVVAVLLVAGSQAHRIDPNTWLLPAFIGLAFLAILAVNGLFMLFWMFSKPRMALIGVLAVVFSWSGIKRHFAFSTSNDETVTETFEIMSFNVRLFDLYNWDQNKMSRDEIFSYLKDKNPEIICFQEFFHSEDKTYFNTRDTLVELVKARHVHEQYTSVMHKGRSKFGIATFSAFPILSRQHIKLNAAENNTAIYTDLLINGDTIRVFNIHLASVHLSGIETELTKHIETNDQDGQVRDIELMTRNLASGFKRRALQSQIIKEHIDASPYPVIVCGDLNDTPGSYAYAHLSRGLNDAFLQHGNGAGITYIGFFPALRIDFILIDPRLRSASFSTEDVELSDHRPVVSAIALPHSVSNP